MPRTGGKTKVGVVFGRERSPAPIIPPRGWKKLEPLVAERRRLGFKLGDVAAAMSVHYDFAGKLERGVSPVSDKMLERYRAALEALKKARGDET